MSSSGRLGSRPSTVTSSGGVSARRPPRPVDKVPGDEAPAMPGDQQPVDAECQHGRRAGQPQAAVAWLAKPVGPLGDPDPAVVPSGSKAAVRRPAHGGDRQLFDLQPPGVPGASGTYSTATLPSTPPSAAISAEGCHCAARTRLPWAWLCRHWWPSWHSAISPSARTHSKAEAQAVKVKARIAGCSARPSGHRVLGTVQPDLPGFKSAGHPVSVNGHCGDRTSRDLQPVAPGRPAGRRAVRCPRRRPPPCRL